MRLIDADPLAEVLVRHENDGMALSEHEYGVNTGLEIAEMEIEDAPTIDAVPVEFIRHLIHALNHGRRNGKVWAAMVLQALLDAWARAERKEE